MGGAMFSPGSSTMAPVNLSSKKSISFWAKGDKRLSPSRSSPEPGLHPGDPEFTPGPEWKEYTFPSRISR